MSELKNKHDFFLPGMREEIELRLSRLMALMADGPEALLIAGNANIYYASGRYFRGYVYIHRGESPVWFIIRPVDLEGEDVVSIHKPEQIPDELRRMGREIPGSIGLELGVLPYSDVMRLAKVFSDSKVVDATSLLTVARMVKTGWEIDRMKEDGIHQAAAYGRIAHIYKEGMTDVEFQIEIERLLRLEGCLGYSRVAGSRMEINLGSVLCGDNADVASPYDFAMGGAGVDAALPGGADGATMMPGTAVMVDMNGAFNGYQTDMTRVWSVGELPPIAFKAHECSRRILRELEQLAKPGVEVCALYRRAEEIAAEEELEQYFMGHGQKAGFIGHGVGIELNEQPPVTGRNRLPLKENMTLALEPKFVIPHVGAVGVENTYVVRPDGLENITIFPEDIKRLDH